MPCRSAVHMASCRACGCSVSASSALKDQAVLRSYSRNSRLCQQQVQGGRATGGGGREGRGGAGPLESVGRYNTEGADWVVH